MSSFDEIEITVLAWPFYLISLQEKEVDLEMFIGALENLYSKSSNTWELAKTKPGFWLMLAGLLHGFIKVIDSL